MGIFDWLKKFTQPQPPTPTRRSSSASTSRKKTSPNSRRRTPPDRAKKKQPVASPSAREQATLSLIAWARRRLDVHPRIAISGAELIDAWSGGVPSPTTKLTRPRSIVVAELLGQHGFGIEPDVRFGGAPVVREKQMVLFQTSAEGPTSPSSAYATAAMLVHLAAVVGAADGTASPDELTHFHAYLQSALTLSPSERKRLDAHIAWLAATEITLRGSGLKKRIDALGVDDRNSIGEVLIAVATADGVISPPEVTSLKKVYMLLGLDPETVTTRLHATLTADGREHAHPRPSRGPVTVREAGPPDAGFPIPPPPSSPHAARPQSVAHGFMLDHAAIQQKFADTDAVSALLVSIFAEDEKGAPPKTEMPSTPTVASALSDDGMLIAGLDAVHSALLRQLATRDSWDASAFAELAGRFHLMPNGARDTLNEAAFDLAGEPLIEGDNPLKVNEYARTTMMNEPG